MTAMLRAVALLDEAVRIERARLVLVDGLDENAVPYTQAKKLEAKAFLSNRRSSWLHEACALLRDVGEYTL